MPCPEYLSRTFPVTKEDIAEYMQKNFKTKNIQISNNTFMQKLKELWQKIFLKLV